MDRREIVRQAIEFGSPPRLPFWQHVLPEVPDDVCDCSEMDRAQRGWFFDTPGEDDWGCRWAATTKKNMGQVIGHPLEEWSRLSSYRPPNPRNPFYFERIEDAISQAGDRYVALSCHFTLFERLHMLHGFPQTLVDLYQEPAKIERILDMILDFKLGLFDELHRRFPGRIDGLFCTDDWGTQQSTFIRGQMFEDFFLPRYRRLIDAARGYGWHYILHTCGKVNAFVPYFLQMGVDVLNLEQPRTYGIEELGRQFAGKVCFLTTADIQTTMPGGDPETIRAEVRELVRHWATPQGGFIVFNYGDSEAIGTTPEATKTMFHEFCRMMHYWNKPHALLGEVTL
jgi:uroporphyrinogen-III decarboxylase